jgi:type II secretory pathway component GspD/PulD (secretin)
MNRSIVLILSLLLCGCAKKRPVAKNTTPIFESLYEELKVAPPADTVQPAPEKRLKLSCERMPVAKLLQFIANETGASLVADEQLDQREVTFEVNDISLPELLGLVARRLGVQLGRVGNTWYLGQLRGEDRGVLVRKVRRLDADGIKTAVQVMLSDAGRLSTFPDGLLVCGDRVEVLERVRDLLDRVESSGAESWVVQLYLISVSSRKSQDMGIDVQPLVELSLALATRSGAASTQTTQAAVLASALGKVLKASATDQNVRIVAQPLFLMLDGESSRFSSGVSIPIAKKVVSDQGTVSTQGYEFTDAGVSCEVGIREVSTSLIRCKVNVELGQVQGFVEQAPIRSKDHFQTSAILAGSGVYLLGALSQSQQSQQADGLTQKLPTRKSSDDKTTQVQIWARLHRVAGPARQ